MNRKEKVKLKVIRSTAGTRRQWGRGPRDGRPKEKRNQNLFQKTLQRKRQAVRLKKNSSNWKVHIEKSVRHEKPSTVRWKTDAAVWILLVPIAQAVRIVSFWGKNVPFHTSPDSKMWPSKSPSKSTVCGWISNSRLLDRPLDGSTYSGGHRSSGNKTSVN